MTNILAGAGGGRPFGNPSLATLGDAVYFVANGTTPGDSLWKWTLTDGAMPVPGTPRIDVDSDRNDASPALEVVGDFVYFVGREADRFGLWRTDGSEAGTILLDGFAPSTWSAQPRQLTAGDNVLFFLSDDGEGGEELWRSDGTAAGTTLVKEIGPDFQRGRIANPTFLDGTLYFSATTSGIGDELWTSDGTTAGTFLLADIAAGQGGSAPSDFHVIGDRLLFAATTDDLGRELWSVDLSDGPQPLGDFDGDGGVNGNDFLAWQRALGTTVESGNGVDANHSGVVDAEDLPAWRTNLGALAPVVEVVLREQSNQLATVGDVADRALAALNQELYAAEDAMPRQSTLTRPLWRPTARRDAIATPWVAAVSQAQPPAPLSELATSAAANTTQSADAAEERDEALSTWEFGESRLSEARTVRR